MSQPHMKRKARRIRDFTLPKREHPHYRKIIETHEWVPHVMCDSVACYWDGLTVRDKDGGISSAISEPAKEQLITMTLSGYFGNEMKDVFVDEVRYMHIRDRLLEWPDQEAIAREALHILDVGRPNLDPTTISRQRELDDVVSESGPTTGPRPSSWSGVVVRDVAQDAFTYAFRFGNRDLWKIGHATDVRARLSEVNKHVPHEVLGERWRQVLLQRWPNEVDAYNMEQHVLGTLRGPSSVGERVSCTRGKLESVWAAALVQKS